MLRTDRANNITLTQGNSAEIGFKPKYTDGDPVRPVEGDRCIFTMKHGCKEVLRKELDYRNYEQESGEIVMVLEPEDTALLPPDSYVYDCLYEFADGSRYTFIPKAVFRIDEAITKVGDGDE